MWFLENILTAGNLPQVINLVKNNIKRLTIIFFVAIFLSIGVFRSSNPSTGIYEMIKLLEYLFLFSYTAKNFRTLNSFVLFSTFIFGVIFESFLTVIQYFNQGSIGGIFYFLGERSFNSQTPGVANASINGQLFLRPYATFSHPNVLAGYLFIFMVLIILYAKKNFFKYQIIVVYLSFTLGTVALFLTMSRVSLFAWSVVLLFFLVNSFWKKTRMVSTKNIIARQIRRKILPLLFLVSSVFIITFPIGLRFFQLSFSDQTVVQREVLIRDSIAMFQQSPIFGVGINNYLVDLPVIQRQHKEVLYIQPVHNIYFLILSETGVVGLILFLYFLWNTYKRLKINTNVELFALFFFILFVGIFDHYFFTLQQGQLLIVIILGLFWSDFEKTIRQKNGNIKS